MAKGSKLWSPVYFHSRLSHCIRVNLPTVKPKIIQSVFGYSNNSVILLNKINHILRPTINK